MGETGRIRVLLVDDDEDFARMTAEFLERTDDALAVETAADAGEGLARLEDGDADCVVSDYEMPGRDGIEFLEAVREARPSIPFILFTGRGSEEVASDAISAGVTDYVRKGGTERYGLLANRITNAVERVRSRTALDERNRRLETLIDNLPGFVYRCRNEPAWPMAYVEGECEELTGYEAADLVSGDVVYGEDVVHPADRGAVWDAVQEGVDAGEPFEFTYRIVAKGGEEKWVWERGRSVRSDGELVALEGFITDITDHVERRNDLERYETIVEASGDPVYALDTEGRMTFVNDALIEMTGHAEDDLLGSHVSMLMDQADIDACERLIRSLLAGSADRGTIEVGVVTVDGERVACEIHIGLLRADGAFDGTVGVVRDVSERKDRERALERQNQRLDEFSSVVSHDLRNPLNVASGGLELAREDLGEHEHFDVIERGLDRMETLIDDLLTLARAGETVGHTEPVDLANLVRECWETVRTPGARLVVETDRTVRADETRLRQLLENLFRNAVEHGSTSDQSPETTEEAAGRGSASSLAAGGDAEDPVSTEYPAGPRPVGDARSGSRAESTTGDENVADVTVTVGDIDDGFFVGDDGTGVPPDVRQRIDADAPAIGGEGAGLGLTIVQQIAEAHGWTISIPDDVDGARFEFTDVETLDADDS